MLGKVRSIALAIMMIGIMGTCAQAGSIHYSSIVVGDGDSFDVSQTFTGQNVNLEVTTAGLVTVTTGTTIAPASLLFEQGAGIDVAAGSQLRLLNASTLYQGTILFQGPVENTVTGYVDASSPVGGKGFDLGVFSSLKMTDATIIADTFTQSGGSIYSAGTNPSEIITTSEKSAYITNGAKFAVNGTFEGGALFDNGATLTAIGNRITIGGNNALSFTNATLDLRSNNVTVDNNVHFNSGSQILLGVTGNELNKLIIDSTVNTGAKVSGSLRNAVSVDTTFSTYHYNQYTTGIPSQPYPLSTNMFVLGKVSADSWTLHNVFGDFGFKSGDAGAWLDSYNRTDIADVSQVKRQLSYNWDERIINYGIASDVSTVAQLMDAGYTSSDFGTAAGQFNYAALEAMANGNSYFTWNGGNGIVDKGLISAMNGSNLSGVNYVAQDVTRDIFTSLHSRLEAYRAVAVDIASDTALGSVADVLNDRYLNRIWAGGLGSWSKAKERKGFEGYKYDGKGVMIGYDRAFGAAIMGIAGAYVEGDYEDKSAASHDSKIKNYAVNAYMTYNASSGFFATLSGGWVYSDNDIRERRGGYWATEDYHTNTWHAEAKLGYDIQPCDNWSISPSVGVNFIHAKGSAHDLELEGVAGATRSYSSAKNHLVEIPVEIQAAYEVSISDVTRVTFMANGGYAYNLNDHAVRGTSITNGIPGATASHIVGRKLGHSSWKAGAGVQVRHDNWDLGVKYDYYGRDKYRNHRLMGTIGYSF